MNLVELVNALHQEMLRKHESLTAKVQALDHLAFEQDAALMRNLEAIIQGQGRRAADIHKMLKLIQARVGYVPSDEHAPLYEAGNPRPTIPPAPEPDDGTKAMAARYAPPLRAESTSGDALGLYDDQQPSNPFGLN